MLISVIPEAGDADDAVHHPVHPVHTIHSGHIRDAVHFDGVPHVHSDSVPDVRGGPHSPGARLRGGRDQRLLGAGVGSVEDAVLTPAGVTGHNLP